MPNPTKRTQATTALKAVEEAVKSPRFGVIAVHFPADGKSGTCHLHPWRMTAGDAEAVIKKLQEHFGLPAVQNDSKEPTNGN